MNHRQMTLTMKDHPETTIHCAIILNFFASILGKSYTLDSVAMEDDRMNYALEDMRAQKGKP